MPHTPWKAELSCFSDADYCTWAVYDQESNEVCRVFEGEEPARLIAQAPAMYELLKKLEWTTSAMWSQFAICPSCDAAEEDGHEPGCAIAAVLKAVEGDI